jgi:hypothetical protein
MYESGITTNDVSVTPACLEEMKKTSESSSKYSNSRPTFESVIILK